jgi:hypothetical protein
MRPRKLKLPLTLDSIQFLLGDKRAHTLGELRLSFAEPDTTIEELLRVGVSMGMLRYYPPSRDICGRYQWNVYYTATTATPRMSPLETKGELKYDMFALQRLPKNFRRS